jgi:O-succinylbenzoate synthase
MLRGVDLAVTLRGLAVHPYAIRLTMPFRGITCRQGAILVGPGGAGEFSPFRDYSVAAAVPWLRAAVEAATEPPPMPRRRTVPVNATVPAVGPEVGAAIVDGSGGCRTVKVKVGAARDTLAAECDRVAAVRAVLGPGGSIRVDANGAWDVETALTRLEALDRAAGGLQYAEQPCRTVEELAEVRRRGRIPIAADESIRLAADPTLVVRRQAADIAVLKVQPLGGVRACLDLAARLDLPVVVSSALETSIGLASGLALAAALPDLPLACGLATAALLSDDATSETLRPVGGELVVRRPPADRVEAVAADAEVSAWWDGHLEAVAGAAGGAGGGFGAGAGGRGAAPGPVGGDGGRGAGVDGRGAAPGPVGGDGGRGAGASEREAAGGAAHA